MPTKSFTVPFICFLITLTENTRAWHDVQIISNPLTDIVGLPQIPINQDTLFSRTG